MNKVFADTYFYLAILNAADRGHHAARVAVASPDLVMVTTEYVILELLDAMCGVADRGRGAAFVAQLMADDKTEVRFASRQLLGDALQLYRSRQDKSWSLTDCTSFVVMRENGLLETLTADVHFQQAGYRALLRRE